MEGTMASIYLWAATFAPKNWLFCQGQLLAIQTNTALFSLLGTTFGGNGTTTFGIPDLRGRMPVGTGQGPGLSNIDLGQMAGTPTVTLSSNQMPAHIHGLSTAVARVAVSDAPATTDEADGSLLTNTSNNFYTTGAATGSLGGVSLSGNTEPAGNSQPVSLMPPYIGINFIICQYGIYPSRP